MVTDLQIIKTYFRSRNGIRGTAGKLGVSKLRVARVILAYKTKNNIR